MSRGASRMRRVNESLREVIAEEVSRLKDPGLGFVTITAVDTVTGPFDVIVQLEAEDLDKLGKAITEDLQTLDGVQRTTTCLSVNL